MIFPRKIFIYSKKFNIASIFDRKVSNFDIDYLILRGGVLNRLEGNKFVLSIFNDNLLTLTFFKAKL